jgi:hypothetical protein
MCHLSQMLECWLHLDDHLERGNVLADFLEEANGKLAYSNVYVVHLRAQESQHPRYRCGTPPYEVTKMVGGEQPNDLRQIQQYIVIQYDRRHTG